MGLPVALAGKNRYLRVVSDLYDVDAHMDADTLNADENTVTIGNPKLPAQAMPLFTAGAGRIPGRRCGIEIMLPDGVELLSYLSAIVGRSADDRDRLRSCTRHTPEQSAGNTGLYVKAYADFLRRSWSIRIRTAARESKSIHVQINEDAAPTQMYTDTGIDGIAAYARGRLRRMPPAITSIAKEGGFYG